MCVYYVCSGKFGLSFFQEFDFVMNALDNKAARIHVNRMCIAGKIPLIESGSAGYLGQVGINDYNCLWMYV